MRIISGTFKGRRFSPPSNITARPTTDFAKEGLFNILDNEIDYEKITALDLFSGTGSISFELASRLSPRIVAIEQNQSHINFIKKTIETLDIKKITVIKADVFKYLSNCSNKFDLIFADPPYELATLTQIPDIIFKNGVLKDNGVLILEHSKKHNFNDYPFFEKERYYGNVHFSFFRKK